MFTNLDYAMHILSKEKTTEYRNDSNEPLLRHAIDISHEATGITHYWKNESTDPVEALVVDILPSDGDVPLAIERTPKLSGPTQNIGISSVQILGETPLDDEFSGFSGKHYGHVFLLWSQKR